MTTADSINKHGDNADEQFFTVDDDAHPVGCRSTKRGPSRKGIRRHVFVDYRATSDYG